MIALPLEDQLVRSGTILSRPASSSCVGRVRIGQGIAGNHRVRRWERAFFLDGVAVSHHFLDAGMKAFRRPVDRRPAQTGTALLHAMDAGEVIEGALSPESAVTPVEPPPDRRRAAGLLLSSHAARGGFRTRCNS
ncbi:hypothetical protein HRbin30_02197 [bacterium HR30]|nr:hypothetical protein HRbin30_02197 [bacterium HR30]